MAMLGVLGFIALGFSVIGIVVGGVLVIIIALTKGSYHGQIFGQENKALALEKVKQTERN